MEGYVGQINQHTKKKSGFFSPSSHTPGGLLLLYTRAKWELIAEVSD